MLDTPDMALLEAPPIKVKGSVVPELFMTMGRAVAILLLGLLLYCLLDSEILIGALLTMTGAIGLVGGMLGLWMWEVWKIVTRHRLLVELADAAPDSKAVVT